MRAWIDALGPMLISGVGIGLIFIAGLVARWRNRRAARRLGGVVVPIRPTSYVSPPTYHPRQYMDVKTHRR